MNRVSTEIFGCSCCGLQLVQFRASPRSTRALSKSQGECVRRMEWGSGLKSQVKLALTEKVNLPIPAIGQRLGN